MPVTFYATIPAGDERPYMPAVPVLLPASSWARDRFRMRAPRLPAHITEIAADSGGFVATLKWGDYRYTPAQYVAWLETFSPSWAATMDFCCEPEVAGGGLVEERQDRTTEMARHFWDNYRDRSWCWVPTVQGWEPSDYRRHARQLLPTLLEMAAHYGPGSAWRVGIGTLCQRADAAMVRRVVDVVADELASVPDLRLHLWGVKMAALGGDGPIHPAVASVDSAAWNGLFGTAREEWRRSGLSQREWGYQVALPRYLRRFGEMISTPRQLAMFGDMD